MYLSCVVCKGVEVVEREDDNVDVVVVPVEAAQRAVVGGLARVVVVAAEGTGLACLGERRRPADP